MTQLLPLIIDKLQGAGLLVDLCNLKRLIIKDKFQLHNVFLLLLDVFRWYSSTNTSPECMKSWKVMHRLFHGKVLRLMSRSKSSGQILDQTVYSGIFDPNKTLINFAVPNINGVRNFKVVDRNIPKELKSFEQRSKAPKFPGNGGWISCYIVLVLKSPRFLCQKSYRYLCLNLPEVGTLKMCYFC